MVAKKKNRSKVPKLALRDLFGAISYWGSAVRIALVGFIAAAVFVVQVLNLQAAPYNATFLSAVLSEGQMFVYVLTSFLILDVGYVIVARKYGFSKLRDTAILLSNEAILGVCYFLPYFAVVSDRFTHVSRFVFVAVLLILSIRIVTGLLFGKAAQK